MNKHYSRIGIIIVTIANILLFIIVFSWLIAPTIPIYVRPSSPPPDFTIPTYTPIPYVDIVVAIQPIPRGQVITADMVDYRSWPEQSAPLSAITDVEYVIGKIARTDIYRESPITNVVLTESFSDVAGVGSEISALLSPGMVAKTLYLSRQTLPMGLMPGDRVEILFSKQTEEGGQITEWAATMAQVIWIGDLPEDGRILPMPTSAPSSSRDSGDLIPITFAVSPMEGAQLAWVEQRKLPFSLLMQSASNRSGISMTPVNLGK